MVARSASRPPCSTDRPAFALAAVVVAVLAFGPEGAAQRLDQPAQDWVRQYRLLVVPDETALLQKLKAADLEEFVRIFWARRNPAPPAADNPFRASIEKQRVAADARFGDVGKKGSETACGQVLMLLGHPDEVTGRELQNTFDTRPSADSRYRRPEPGSRNATRDGARRPELWTYKSNASRTFRMAGGDLKLQFDDGCEFDEGARTLDELARLAAERVLHPEIRYEFGADGRLRPLTALAPSPVRALLDQPRADFVVAFEPTIQVPGQGGAYTAGIVRGAPGAVAVPQGGTLRLRVITRAAPAAGPAVFGDERDVYANVQPDGSFVTSYGVTLPPGRHAVAVAVLDPASGRGAVTGVEIEAPDYAGKAMVVGPLAVLAGGGDRGPAPAGDPYDAFIVGTERLAPRPGNVLTQSDSLRLLVPVHNATLDPTTSRPSWRASFSVLQDGRLVAKGKDQSFDTSSAVPSVGPIPLTPFAPGRYLARVDITDEVAKTVVVRETPFEVTPPPAAR